jgi:hypothetical protein
MSFAIIMLAYVQSMEDLMAPDVRPWYHLLYITDQIKSADQKAYIGITVLCTVIGFSHQGFSHVIRYLLHNYTHPLVVISIFTLIVLCAGGLVAALSEFYHIVFPKMNGQKYMKTDDCSVVFWLDVASMTFPDFKNKYLKGNREDDLIVQIYILSKIAKTKYSGIKNMYKIITFTVACDVTIFILAKVLTQ